MTIQERAKKAIEAANQAFWAEIVKAFPEAKTGDFDPMDAFIWTDAEEQAVHAWLQLNLPGEDVDTWE